MCGILGILCRDDNGIDQRVEAALHTMYNRGPNDKGTANYALANGKQLTLGHTRLSIIDLSSGGHQPMSTNCGRYHIVFNGEIYNYKELRQELCQQSYTFSTESDTEVLLAAWQAWGEGCLVRLIGMFAFVIYDQEGMTLTCIRDAFGIKPFLYTYTENEFTFASDIHALLKASTKKPTINWQTSYEYLVQGTYDGSEHTFFEGVTHLMPGCILTLNLATNHLTTPKTWWAPPIEERSELTFLEAAELVRRLFLENIRLHLRTDVPLGAALSGGIDSSAIVCAIRYLEPNIPINTFSYIAKDSPLSEEKWIDKVNNYVGAKSHKIIATGRELAKDLDDMIITQGEPFGSTSIYAQYRVFQAAKKAGITVTLDGQGADELLAGYQGYPIYRIQTLLEKKQFLKAIIFTKNWKKRLRKDLKTTMLTFGSGLLLNSIKANMRHWVKNNNYPKWVNKKTLTQYGITPSQSRTVLQKNIFQGRRVIEFLRSSLQHLGLPQLLRHGDRNSMRFSIESRVPFLTTQLANLLLSLPEEYLIAQNGTTKAIFREAMRGIVPDTILNRDDKIGFETTEYIWMKEISTLLKKHLTILKEVPFIQYDVLIRNFEEVMSGKETFTTQIWRWVNFARWLELVYRKYADAEIKV